MDIINFPVGPSTFVLAEYLSAVLEHCEHVPNALGKLFVRIKSSLNSSVWSWTFKDGQRQRTFTVRGGLSEGQTFKRNRVTFDLGQGLCFIDEVTLHSHQRILLSDREGPCDLFKIPPATLSDLLEFLFDMFAMSTCVEKLVEEDPSFSPTEDDFAFPPVLDQVTQS